ncbi:MAG TPA: pyrimidine 5'-nucleotidase [Desulfarculaceae bacterium]|nr:pyrimidine 5'-nucleotidase [Desulfarculaceae bacterium]
MSVAKFILFDLDNTIYPRSCGLFDHIDSLINRYLREVVKIPAPEVDLKRRMYMREHGTTLNGLITHHNIDPHDYLEFVHNVPLEDYLEPDTKLKTMLSELPEKKYIFSNASSGHCQKVLDFLGIQKCFAAIFDINYFDFRPKPDIEIYQELLDDIEARAEEGVMIDDMEVNLKPAVELGLATILFDPAVADHNQHSSENRPLTSLLNLPQVLEEISSGTKG